MIELTFNDYSDDAIRTAIYPKIGSNPVYPALGLAGETGEYCEKLKKAIRDDGGNITAERREAMILELGDILWYINASALELGVSLEEIAERNIEKLHRRRDRNTIHGEGDDR